MKSTYTINKEFDGYTIRKYLEHFYLGKTKIYLLFQEGRITKDGCILKERDIIHTNDIILVDIEESIDFISDAKKLDIVYEDDYFLFVNKPKNILVHPDDKNKTGTMCNIVSYYYKNKNINASVKYAHRLDIDTTGILMFSKDSLCSSYLHHIISTHELKRTYLCLCEGILKNKKDVINLPIGEDRHHNQRRRVSKTGQTAITHYEVIKEFNKYSLLKVVLETGRTHQIRVHLSHIGHPLLGDVLYGAKTNNRVMLHSHQVEFIHPVTMEKIIIKKDLPFDMRNLIKQ